MSESSTPPPKHADGSKELHGKTAVVTGSSSGIGRAIAVELARAGADIVVHGRRNRKGAEDAAAQIQSLGSEAQIALFDLADRSTHETLVDQSWQWHGAVDIWVNNAGADVLTGEAAHLPFDEKLDILWQVDVMATVRLSRLVGDRMKQRGEGVILNIGWDQAEQGMAGESGQMFGTVKGAVMALSRSLAQTLAPEVRVNCLAPGWIRTAWGETADTYWNERACRESLVGRWGTPADVAAAARFLASPNASFMTGHVFPVNGGFRYGAASDDLPAKKRP